jgi:ABC-type phosphate/phosphonate transport system substrate-binding protein
MTIASLAMYPFAHLRSANDQFWDSVRSRLPFATPALEWELDPLAARRRDDLLLGQTCGWPLVTELAPTVRVIGTFDFDVDGAIDGTYRSVLVTGTGDSLDAVLRRPDLVVAANAADSLSGWISLNSVAIANDVLLDRIEWTGAHALSVEALREGRAHLAAIDAVTWAHLGGTDTGLTVIGHGPRIPCLPLVTSGSTTDVTVDQLRAALAATVQDPELASACVTLKIREFLVRDLADYESSLTTGDFPNWRN